MNRLQTLVARRYLFSRKSHSVINMISAVSAVAIGVPVAAMVILLSVFNGFEGLVKGLYKDFDPDIVLKPASGKVFAVDSLPRDMVSEVEGVECVSYVLEDNVLAEYAGRQFIVNLRGVDSLFERVIPIEGMVVSGEWKPIHGQMEQALVGRGVAYNLGLRETVLFPLRFMVPRRGNFSTLLPVDAYRERSLFASGIFALDLETDGSYVIVPIGFARSLFDYPDMASAVMVKTAPWADTDMVKAELAASVGPGYGIFTRYEQKEGLYRLMKFEKWGIFFIALLVLIIASFSMVGSLVMLIIDKRQGIRTLMTMGAGVGFVRGVFVREGMMISTAGAVGGLLLGLGVCAAQIHWGLLKMPASSFLVEDYPVAVEFTDLLWIAAVFSLVNFFIAKFAAWRMIPRSELRL